MQKALVQNLNDKGITEDTPSLDILDISEGNEAGEIK